jgi:threonine dehydratase
VATALRELAPEARVVGVEVEGWDGVLASLAAGTPTERRSAASIADGIAVKRPGDLTLKLIQERVDDIVTVAEDDVAEAMVHLLERAKLVVEGAGAVGVAALMTERVRPVPSGTTAVVLSGGNVDAGLLAAVARRHETEVGRRLVLRTRIPDRPGQLARMLACVAGAAGNVLAVEHLREGVSLHVRETGVQLVLETRGREHADAVVAALEEAGYPAEVS